MRETHLVQSYENGMRIATDAFIVNSSHRVTNLKNNSLSMKNDQLSVKARYLPTFLFCMKSFKIDDVMDLIIMHFSKLLFCMKIAQIIEQLFVLVNMHETVKLVNLCLQ